MQQSRWQYATAVLMLLLLFGVLGCAVERGEVYVKDGKRYGVVSGIWRNKWWQHYERGVSYAAGGFWDDAIASFQTALASRPGQKDRLRANTYGVHFVEGYFPHRELGIVHYRLTRYAQAQRELHRGSRSAAGDDSTIDDDVRPLKGQARRSDIFSGALAISAYTVESPPIPRLPSSRLRTGSTPPSG